MQSLTIANLIWTTDANQTTNEQQFHYNNSRSKHPFSTRLHYESQLQETIHKEYDQTQLKSVKYDQINSDQ